MNFEDFTENNYRKILNKINNKTIFYDEIDKYQSFTLWRHDIDFSVHRSVSLAIIENEENILSTYFLQLGSKFYNLFEQEIKEKIFKILELGHKIGLHFDPTQYDIESKKELEKYLKFEKNILEKLFDTQITVFSFHNPTTDILKFEDFKYANMINTYAKYFSENVKYCSDSNGYWRFERLEDFLDRKYEKIQVLTHPAWWQKETMSPFERIKRSVYGRCDKILKYYEESLRKHGRKNVK